MSPEWPATTENNPESIARLSVTLHRLDEAHRRYRFHAARVVGIRPTELSALLAISDNPGMTPGALGRDIILSSGATTAVIDRLEISGHIHRTTDPADRRSLHLHLTDQGAFTMTTLREAYQYVLSTTGTDDRITGALPQLDSITHALNTASRGNPIPRN